MPTRLKLEIAYDGTQYSGWQIQARGTGVQELIERALNQLFSGSHRVYGSSRTDAGVHALGMAAHVDIDQDPLRMEVRRMPLAINSRLPEDIRVLDVRRVSTCFHARFDAIGKEYRYLVWNHTALNPLLRHQAWHVPQPLDFAAIKNAVPHFVGRHDFRSLAANHTYAIENTIRTLHQVKFVRQGPLLTFTIRGDGFLYRMCRGIVGTLIQTGRGKFHESEIRTMLRAKDRRAGGMSAPACGLVLRKVFYPPGAMHLGRTTHPPGHIDASPSVE